VATRKTQCFFQIRESPDGANSSMADAISGAAATVTCASRASMATTVACPAEFEEIEEPEASQKDIMMELVLSEKPAAAKRKPRPAVIRRSPKKQRSRSLSHDKLTSIAANQHGSPTKKRRRRPHKMKHFFR